MSRTALPLLARSVVALCVAALAAPPVLAQEPVELPLTGPAYQLADQAYRAYAQGDYSKAARQAREALRLRPDVARLRQLVAQSESALRQRSADIGRMASAAPQARRATTPTRPTRQPATHYARGPADTIVAVADDGLPLRLTPMLWRSAPAASAPVADTSNDDEAPLQLAASLPADRPLNLPVRQPDPVAPEPPTPAERAYRAMQAGRPREAADAFAEADRDGTLQPRQLQDAAYASLDAGDAPAAARYFRRALDAADAGEVQIAPQARQDIRVAVADQERTWGASAAAFYRGGGTIPGLPAQGGGTTGGGTDRSLQAVAEAYWRPAALKGFNGGGTYVDVYGRLLGTGYSGAGYAEGGDSLQATVGVRAKPLSSVNLVGAVEKLVKVGSASRDDWLLRLGYSNGFNTAPRVDRGPWWTGDVYAETGRYLRADEHYVVSEARLGRSWRIDPQDGRWPGLSSLVFTPHVVLAADYNTGFAQPRAIGAGVGLAWRAWLREDNRSGPRSYADLSVQYRAKLSGDDRAGGLVLRLSYNH